MRSQDFVSARDAHMVKVMFAAAGLLLLIACANVANLMLARGLVRRREFALRLALGASRGRLAAHVLGEGMIIALAASVLGVGIAKIGLSSIVALRAGAFPALASAHVDVSAMVWSIALAVVSGTAFGALPAFVAAKRPPAEVLRSGGRSVFGNASTRQFRRGLVVSEVALSFVLVASAGLLVHSFVNLVRTPLGFDAANLLWPTLVPKKGVDHEAASAQAQAVVNQLRGAPGISAIQSGTPPLGGGVHIGTFQVEGADGPMPTDVHIVALTMAEPGYFRFAGIAMLAGRGFDSSGVGSEGERVVIGHALAQRLWPDRNPVGLRFRGGPSAPWVTVIGVAADIKFPARIGDASELQMYVEPKASERPLGFQVRARDAGLAEFAMRKAVEEVAPGLVLERVRTPQDLIDFGLVRQRFAIALMTAFAVLALGLAAAGLYGVIAYSVSSRSREIAIRVAVGASPAAVSRLVLGEGFQLTAAGMGIGIIAALYAARALKTMLFGLNPLDPVAFVTIGGVFLVATLVAVFAPMRRALGIDPPTALRGE
jgi:predicted permease